MKIENYYQAMLLATFGNALLCQFQRNFAYGDECFSLGLSILFLYFADIILRKIEEAR